ncbi:sodium:pantothenate symporter [Oceanobacillus sp. FSL W7-1293]|uniref:sodium:solute symporter family protein n=1 Tax=Oceanobacillus sp. FSL W7-1293 TaxID=2921699 RepID=UPI0030CFAA7A
MDQIQIYMWIGFIIFIGIMVFLSYLGYKKTSSIEDFSIASASLGPIVLGLAYAATFFSATTFIGYPGWAYDTGFSTLWIFLTLIVASPLGLIVVAKRARLMNIKQKSLSLSDWLGDRYNSDFVRVGTAIVCLFNIFAIASQFAAGAWIFNTLLDIPYSIGLLITMIFVISYVYAGGSYADIYTDAVQAVLMGIMGVFVFFSALWVFDGGFTGAFSQIDSILSAENQNLTAIVNPESLVFYSVPAIVGAFIIQFAFSSQPQLFNKVLALKDPRDMRKMIITYVVCAMAFLLVIFGGLYAAVEVTVEHPDQALLAYVMEVFPAIIVAFLGVTVIAAAMSTTDGLFVVMSTVIANDIYRKYLVPKGIIKTPPEKVDKVSLKISRYMVVIVGIIAYLLVLNPPESLGMFLWIGISGVASGTMGPLLAGLFWPKIATTAAACASLVAGVVSYIVIVITDFEESNLAAGAWAVLVGVFVMIIVGVFTHKRNTGGADHVG